MIAGSLGREARSVWPTANWPGLGSIQPTGTPDSAARCAEDALRIARSPHRPLVLCQALRTVGELTAARREWAVAIGHFEAALALAVRCEAPFERGRTELAIGELRIAEHRPAGRTTPSRAGGGDLFGACRNAISRSNRKIESGPVPTGPSVNPFGLTAREAEVLRLSAQGLTDAAVGARLYISPRTVSQHLRSVYGKLSVHPRDRHPDGDGNTISPESIWVEVRRRSPVFRPEPGLRRFVNVLGPTQS